MIWCGALTAKGYFVSKPRYSFTPFKKAEAVSTVSLNGETLGYIVYIAHTNLEYSTLFHNFFPHPPRYPLDYYIDILSYEGYEVFAGSISPNTEWLKICHEAYLEDEAFLKS